MEGWARNRAVDIWWERAAAGGGEPLLLVNGLGSPSVAFEAGFVELFVAAGFDVVRFDNRDVGRSSRVPEGDYTLSDMAGDAVAVLDAVGWPAAVVFGQSMGGLIAQQVALEHPDRVQAIVSFMSATRFDGPGRPSEEIQAALASVPPADPDGWLQHRLETERLWASPDAWAPDWVIAKARAMIAYGVDPQGAARQYQAIVAAGNRDAALATLDVPTLVMHGSADALVLPEAGRHTAAVIPGAHYVEIEGLGHDLPPAYWDRVVAPVARRAWREGGRHFVKNTL